VSPSALAQSPSLTTLEPGKPVERSLKGGDKHEYQIDLKPGQFVHVEVNQAPGFDILVCLSSC
jgi:hypothetical protein